MIVGLGNPGPKYQLTRHNVGFLFIDALVEAAGMARRFKNEFKSETLKFNFAGESLVVCKPQTFMNLSGEAVQPLMKFYGANQTDLLVVHDEVDIPFGALRFQTKRGHGGHNGIRDIHRVLGSNEYDRLRLGVDRPSRPGPEVSDWVLGNFSGKEQAEMPSMLERAIRGTETWLRSGLAAAATQFNGADSPAPTKP